MEKQKPHYLLKAIQAQMTTPESMNLTLSAATGIRAAGLTQVDALTIVQSFTSKDFYKSMTTNENHKVWQDVYHAEWLGASLYVKFQRAGEYFVISFKER
jgi:motility quorum-sensing regulator/GCU-specific mRNA interferase toxin